MNPSSSEQQRGPLLAHPQPNDGKSDNKRSCLSPSWTKTFLIFFTLIIMAISLAFIGLGIYFTAMRNPLYPVLLGERVYLNNYLMITVGILLTVVCVFGFVAISKNYPVLLKLYAIILAVALLLQFGAAAAALVYYTLAYDWNADTLSLKLKNEYHLPDSSIGRAVDDLQKEYRCCGARSYKDWRGSGFELTANAPQDFTSSKPFVVPKSCCIGLNNDCGKIIHPSNIFYNGCMKTITEGLNSTLFVIWVVLFALATVELIGVILACCYWKAPKSAY